VLPWRGADDDGPGFDCLLVTEPGTASGLQAVATGLAAKAGAAVYLSPAEQGSEHTCATLAAARELVERARRERRPVLLFGAPAAVAGLCATVLEARLRLPLPDDALLVTGGGWKRGWAGLGPDDLPALLAGAFGLGPDQQVDVYGMSECNTYLVSCPAGRYHVPPLLEAAVVGADLRARRGPDETGQIALLDPFAFCYPGFLLTGDTGRLVRTPCLCGLEGPGFEGRIERAPGEELKGCAGLAAGVSV
jgi:hypothetical protein